MPPLRLLLSIALLAPTWLAPGQANAQWTLQDSHTTASLRGIAAVSTTTAWASGTNGTVLHTTDGGTTWQPCTIPPGADKLDFRGIQAFEDKTAIIMASGKGPLSAIYRTTDACQTWTKTLDNPDPDGFFDAILFTSSEFGYLLGDPVHGSFILSETYDGGKTWTSQKNKGLRANSAGQGIFAASNSSFIFPKPPYVYGFGFATGGSDGAFLYEQTGSVICLDACSEEEMNRDGHLDTWIKASIPVGSKSESSGVFSLAYVSQEVLVAVGGDYKQPDESSRSAAYSKDGGEHWAVADTRPHGYRSAVAYDPMTKSLITVGPNGTDFSTDDGKNWHPLKPGPDEPADADTHWNALSLPFVVGPGGRIGKLRGGALSVAKKQSGTASQ